MTQLLQTAIMAVQKLSPDQQDLVAYLMLSITKGQRPLGLAGGLIKIPDDFNTDLSQEELDAWYKSHPDDPLT